MGAETVGDSQHTENMDLNNILVRDKFMFFVQYFSSVEKSQMS